MFVISIVQLKAMREGDGCALPVPPATSRCFIPGKGFNLEISLKEKKQSLSDKGSWLDCEDKRNGKSKQQQPVLPQPMQSDAHDIVHEVVAGSHAAENVANQFALFLFAHLLVPW